MKSIHIIIITLFFSHCSDTLHAQQLALLTQYREMQGVLNPASISRDFIRFKHKMLIGTSYRQQWIAAPQAPSTLIVQTEWLKEAGNTHIISGLYMVDDKIGKESVTGVNSRVGILISDNPQDYGFALGLNSGMVHYRVRLSETTARDPDPTIGSDRRKWHPDIGAGLFGYMKTSNDHLVYGGFSIPQVFGFKALQLSANQDIIRYRHYYLMGGYVVPLNTENSSIELSTWTKFVPHVAPNVDLNLRFNYNDQFQVGVGFNTNKSLLLEASYTLGSGGNYDFSGLWRIGYSHTMNLSTLSTYMGNAREFHLSMAF